jgi:hypothetical protein
MKNPLLALTILGLLAAPAAAQAQRLQLDSLERLASVANEKVNIDIEPAMLQLVVPFLKGSADEAAIKKMLSQLKGIYVRSFEFDRDVDVSSDLDPIRKQLTTGSWTRLIGVDNKSERESVEIYSWREGDASGGLAILVAERSEVTVVNIVGPFDLSMLAGLRGLGVPAIPATAPR